MKQTKRECRRVNEVISHPLRHRLSCLLNWGGIAAHNITAHIGLTIDVVIGDRKITLGSEYDQALGDLRGDGLPLVFVMPDIALRAANAFSQGGLGDPQASAYGFDGAHAINNSTALLKNNSYAFLLVLLIVVNWFDMRKPPKPIITDEHKRESKALREIWEKAGPNRPTQAEFGETFNIGSQAAVGHFLRGTSAISLKAARGFAQGLNCQISDFSPRLAAMQTTWPFELVDRERYEALPLALRFKAQVRMQDEIEALEPIIKANGTYN